MGEGEISYDALLDLYKKMKQEGASRKDFFHEAAKIPGIYVPSLYEVSYKEDGTIAGFEPVYEDVPRTVTKQIVTDMTQAVYPENRLYHLSRQHRTAWFLRSSEAVSVAVVSARRVWSTVRHVKKMWNV